MHFLVTLIFYRKKILCLFLQQIFKFDILDANHIQYWKFCNLIFFVLQKRRTHLIR